MIEFLPVHYRRGKNISNSLFSSAVISYGEKQNFCNIRYYVKAHAMNGA